MSAVVLIWKSNMKKYYRNKMESIGSLIQPILWLLIFSVGMSSFMSGSESSFSYMTFVLPGMIGFTLVSACVNGGTAWLSDRMNGVVKTYQVAPISRFAPLIANVFTIISKSIIQVVIIVLMGLLLGASLKITLMSVVFSVILIGLFGFGFAGVALYFSSKASNSGAYHMVIFMFQMPLLFFSNALYSAEQLPTLLKIIVKINPMSSLISGLRDLLINPGHMNYPALIVQIGYLSIFGLFGLFIAKKAYSKIIWND